MGIHGKLEDLKEIIKDKESIAIAFSGGVDSTFLLKIAKDVLGNSIVAVTARSSTYPYREFSEAAEFARNLGVRHIVITSEELDIEGFSDNPTNRCYFCKHELFTKILGVAKENNIAYVADGSNMDDLDDFRPGMQALKEFGVLSPLRDARMTKDDIRLLSKELGLPTWDKQPFACLSSRFPYGERITREKLDMVDRSEQYLINLGIKQVRVRHHGDIARIEVSPYERSKFFDEELMDKIYFELKNIGYNYVALDLKGYRTGSMNESLDNS